MIVTETIADLRAATRHLRAEGRTLGLVPTMGFLHAGHMALVEAARARGDAPVLSIFVNPTQFGPNEDLDAYPRDLPRDLALCERNGVEVVFAPGVAEMYAGDATTTVEVGALSSILIGAHRPGHFRGVATVVTKLFNIAGPDRAYFGEKDFQQLAVIRAMVADLCSPVDVVGVPTVRDTDGLALSSRNVRLSPAERQAARVIPRALREAAAAATAGERDTARLAARIARAIGAEPPVRLQSVDVRDAATLQPLPRIEVAPAVALVTAHVGPVLLIDQMMLLSGAAS